MLAFWLVSSRRTHAAKRHISYVRPCASDIGNEFKSAKIYFVSYNKQKERCEIKIHGREEGFRT